MKPSWKYGLLVGILTILLLVMRLIISFQMETPSYESYFTIVQMEEIAETGTPRFTDEFSYQGREYVFTSFFYYLMTAGLFFGPPLLVAKVLPNILLALLIPIMYLLGHRLTGARWPGLISAVVVGFSPILFSSYVNTASPTTLALPLLGLALLGLLSVEERPVFAITSLIILLLVSPLAWLLPPPYLTSYPSPRPDRPG